MFFSFGLTEFAFFFTSFSPVTSLEDKHSIFIILVLLKDYEFPCSLKTLEVKQCLTFILSNIQILEHIDREPPPNLYFYM